VHEAAPDVAPTALATIHGHIRLAVKVAVDHSGNVARATLATHSPSRYFTRLATETARKWKFAAADEQGTRKWLLWFEFTREGASAHAANRRP
jgi:TonB family protein